MFPSFYRGKTGAQGDPGGRAEAVGIPPAAIGASYAVSPKSYSCPLLPQLFFTELGRHF